MLAKHMITFSLQILVTNLAFADSTHSQTPPPSTVHRLQPPNSDNLRRTKKKAQPKKLDSNATKLVSNASKFNFEFKTKT
jgi:hypothetical protein